VLDYTPKRTVRIRIFLRITKTRASVNQIISKHSEELQLQNAASVTGLLMTTEAVVTERQKKKAGMPTIPPGGMSE
jgi:chaperonin GroEL (HSP60 family)